MKKLCALKGLLTLTTLTILTPAFAESKSSAVGSGLAYPGSHEALFQNPAGLSEGASLVSLQGLYFFDDSAPFASVTGGLGSVGLAAAWYNSADVNELRTGLGFGSGALQLGLSLASDESFNAIGVDAAFNYDLSGSRLAIVLRDVTGGISRVDLGLGFSLAGGTLGIDVKKPLPFSENSLLLSVGVALPVALMTVAVGSDLNYDTAGFGDPNIWAAINIKLTTLALDIRYRALPQELGLGTWRAGVTLAL